MSRQPLRALLLLLLCVPWSGVFAAEVKHLTFGLFPNLSPRTLVSIYQPMRNFIEAELGRPVELVTASNFNIFTRRMLAKEYDLVVAAPHLARLAQTDAGYELLAHYEQPLQACVVVSVKSSAKNLKDLSGKRVAVPDKVAIVTWLGLAMLTQAGLRVDQDYRMLEAKSHNNAALNVVNGQAEAAVIGSVPLSQLTKEVRDQLRVIGRSAPIPSQYFAVSDRLSSQERKQIEQALFKFANTADGRKFLSQFAMLGISKAKPNELVEMDVYAKQVRQLLSEPVAP